MCFGRMRTRTHSFRKSYAACLAYHPTDPYSIVMSNDAVIRINQISRGAIGANNTSPFQITLSSPDDYTDLGAIPGLAAADAAGGWSRLGQEAALDLAESIGETLRESGVQFRVEWV